MDRVSNAGVRELCRVKKGLGETINEGILQWFSHVERMESDKTAKSVYVEEYTGSHSVDRLRKR